MASYGLFVSNSNGPGVLQHTYGSNMSDGAYYVGACNDCNVTIDARRQEYFDGLQVVGAGRVYQSSQLSTVVRFLLPTASKSRDCGIVILIDTVRRSARPHDAVLGWVERLGRYADVSLHRSASVTPGVVVYRLDDRLFFANARYFKGRVREAIRAAQGPVRRLVLDAEAITHTDATGLEALADVVKDLRRDEITLVVARLRTRMEEQFEDAGVMDAIGRGHLYPTVRAAVEASETPDGGS